MGVFRNENAAALLFRDTQKQGKCEYSIFPVGVVQGFGIYGRFPQ